MNYKKFFFVTRNLYLTHEKDLPMPDADTDLKIYY